MTITLKVYRLSIDVGRGLISNQSYLYVIRFIKTVAFMYHLKMAVVVEESFGVNKTQKEKDKSCADVRCYCNRRVFQRIFHRLSLSLHASFLVIICIINA